MPELKKFQKILNISLLVVIVVILGISIKNYIVKENQRKFEEECSIFKNQLEELNIVDYKYTVKIINFYDHKLIVGFEIYNYEESMNKEFDTIFDSIINEFKQYKFRTNKVKEIQIHIIDYEPHEDGSGGTGHGVATKESVK